MDMKEIYKNDNIKKYDDLKDYFVSELEFSKSDTECITNSEKLFIELYNLNSSRVWLLFASKDNSNWECLQVAQSKNQTRQEIKELLEFMNTKLEVKEIEYKNSAFYDKVCPYFNDIEYRKLLYSKIFKEFKYFKISFLNVDKYLEINPNVNCDNDSERIIEICKNQYAEAKVAYQTKAKYWRCYSSGIDGQTLSYIVINRSQFQN